MDLPLIEADPLDQETWEALEPDTIRAVAILLPEDERNLEVCRFVRNRLTTARMISRVHDATQASLFIELDVQIINPSLSPVVELEYLLLYPSVSSLITDLEDEHDITEIRLRCTELTDRPLRELELPQGATIVLVRRDNNVIYPHGNMQLQIGDRLTLMGPLDSVRELAKRCE